VIGITAGLKTSDYSYLLARLLLLPCAARGSVRRRGNTRARPVRRTKAISDLAAGSPPAGRPRSRSICEGAGRRDPDRRCAQTASIDRPSDFAVVAVGPGRISRNAHVASRPDAENGRGRLAGARGCASSFDGGCFESPRAGDRARGAPCKARTAADPDRRSSGRQSRNCAAPGFEPTCRTAAVASRSSSANRSCAVAAFSAPRIGAARQPPDQLRSADRGLRHLSAYRVSAERHASGSPFGSRRPN
jgi:hypothetical protein